MKLNLLHGPRRTQRGFYLIGLLLTLVIILILAGGQWNSQMGSTPAEINAVNNAADAVADIDPDATTNVKSAVNTIDRARGKACEAQRATLAGELNMAQMGAGGGVPDRFDVRPRVQHIQCPDRGTFSYDDSIKIYCSIHNPPPEGLKVHKL